MKRLGIRGKFILLLLVLLLLIFSSVATILIRQNSHKFRDTLNEQSVAFGKLATNPIGDTFLIYQDSGTVKIKQQVDKYTDLNRDVAGIAVVDVSGKVLFKSENQPDLNVTPEEASSFEAKYTYNPQREITKVVQPYIEGVGAHRYSVVYSISSERVDKAITDEKKTILAASAVAMLVSVIVAYELINYLFVRPVRNVSRLALVVSGGNFQRQIEIDREDEIGDLAASVNKMANSLKADIVKLKEVDKMKTEFMMIASHNLRTPLSIIDGYVEMADAMNISDEVRGILKTISANSVRLGRFAEDMLIISTIESGNLDTGEKKANVTDLLNEVKDDFSKMTVQKKLNITWNAKTDGYEADISKTHLRSAVWNLLDNAFKFTNEGKKVNLTSSIVNNKLEIIVQDEGIGISATEMPKLFTKFHRATSTLTYDYEGTGIGLYLTKLIIEQHQGKVEVESQEGKGSKFKIILPVHKISASTTVKN